VRLIPRGILRKGALTVVGVGAVGFVRRFGSALCVVVVALAATTAARAQCVLPYQLTNADLSDGAKLTANFNALAECISAQNATNAIAHNAGNGRIGGTGPLNDGQLVVGSSGSAPQAATIAPGAGIAVANGPGTITISATSGGANTPLYRQVMSDTPTSTGTGLANWLNQGSASVSDSAVGICIDAPSSGSSANLTGRYKSAPATSYAITILLAATRTGGTSPNGVGIGWYDGTAKLHVLSYQVSNGVPFLTVNKWNSVTSFSASDATNATTALPQPIWLRISDDGTNVTFAFSQDGSNFVSVYSIAKASGFLGSSGYSNVIFFVDPRSSRTLGTVMSWTQS
jgi:hypothetical protein